MKLLLVETTHYAPISPLFKEACEAKAVSDPSFSWRLMDEGMYSWPWTFEYNLLARAAQFKPDVVLFVKGTLATKGCLWRLRPYVGRLVCWQPDDPWNPSACHQRIQEAIPYYHLYATCKTSIIDDLKKDGAEKVVYVPCGYKPEIHFIDDSLLECHAAPFKCEVAVIGGADEERIGIVKHLLKAMPDLNLKLYGGYWDRDPSLAKYAEGHVYGWAYRAAIRHAKVVLNILRSQNRDQHNMKSLEIPACGGTMLTEKTKEHSDLGLIHYYYSHTNELPRILSQMTHVSSYVSPQHTWNARLEQILGNL